MNLLQLFLLLHHASIIFFIGTYKNLNCTRSFQFLVLIEKLNGDSHLCDIVFDVLNIYMRNIKYILYTKQILYSNQVFLESYYA